MSTVKNVVSFFGFSLIFSGVILYYFQEPKVAQYFDSWNEYLESAVLGPVFPLSFLSTLDFIGSFFCCRKYRLEMEVKKSWFETLLSCTLMHFGGTIIIGVLLGQPPGWMFSSATFPPVFLSWWLTFQCPDDMFWNFIHSNDIYLYVLGLLNVFNSGHATGSWGTDKALNNEFHLRAEDFSKSYLICILCGTICGCGGGLLYDMLNFGKAKSFTLTKSPSIFHIKNFPASASLNNAFLSAVIYYMLANENNFMLCNFRLPLVTCHSLMFFMQLYLYLLEYHLEFDLMQWFSTNILKTMHIQTVIKPMEIDDKEKIE